MRFDRRWRVLGFLLLSFGAIVQSSDNQILVYKKKYIMGTVFEIAAYGSSSEQASSAIDKAFQEIVRMDDLMSNYKPESPVSRLNRSAHFHAEKVPPDLYRVIEEAMHFSRISDGKFDITVAPLVDLWKAALSGDSIPSQSEQQQARACIGYEKVATDSAGSDHLAVLLSAVGFRGDWQGLRGGSGWRSAALTGHPKCIHQRRGKHGLGDWFAPRADRLAGTPPRSFSQTRSVCDAQGRKPFDV